MARFTAVEEPEVAVKPAPAAAAATGGGGAPGAGAWWSPRTRAGALLAALALYVYVLLFIKTMYLKNQRLDRIMDMAVETEKMMQHVQNVHQTLALKVDQLEELNSEY